MPMSAVQFGVKTGLDVLKLILPPLVKEVSRRARRKDEELEAVRADFADPVALSRYYVPQNCQHYNPADEVGDTWRSDAGGSALVSLNNFIAADSVGESDGRNHHFVLADAGMGKTSLLLMLKMMHIGGYWRSGDNVILLKLGESTLEAIATIRDKANTVLLLDSLDEDAKARRDVRQRTLDLIRATLGFRRVIVTCRTQFFPEPEQDKWSCHHDGVLRFGEYRCKVFFLSLFTQVQVEEYLEKRFPGRWWERLFGKKVQSREEAKDIVEQMETLRLRPMLLQHIDELCADIGTVWDEYSVYSRLIHEWVRREAIKLERQSRDDPPTSEQLLEAAIELAVHMQVEERGTIDAGAFRKLAAAGKHLRSLERLEDDGKSLLNRNSKGEFRFSHYSVQEFLVVEHSVKRDGPPEMADIPFTGLMVRFATLAMRHERLRADAFLEFGATFNVKSQPFWRKPAELNSSRADLTRYLEAVDFSNIRIPRNADLAAINLRRANFAGASLVQADLTGANLFGANLFGADLREADLREADLREADLRDADLSEVNLSGTDLTRADLTGADLKGADLTGTLGIA